MSAVIATDTCAVVLRVPGATTVYSEGFESGTGSWTVTTSNTAWSASVSRFSLVAAHGGTYSLSIGSGVTSAGSTTTTATSPTFATVVGQVYTATVWINSQQAGGGNTWTLSATGGSSTSATVPLGNVWNALSLTWTATATTSTISLAFSFTSSSGAVQLIDDVLVTTTGIVDATWTPKVKAYSVTLDEAHSPYADATLTIVTPTDAAQLAQLDPTTGARMRLTLGKTGVQPVTATSTRTFDLRLRSSTVNAADGTMQLGLSSDETALLISGKGGTAVDTTYNTATDLRALVSTVLAGYGYSLAAGTVTADITRTINQTNLLVSPNTPSAYTGSWGAVSCSRDTADTSWNYTGDGNCWNLYGGSTADCYIYNGLGNTGLANGMQVGKTYTFSATGRTKVAFNTSQDWDTGHPTDLRTRRLVVVGYSSTYPGGYILATSPAIPATVGVPTRVSTTFTLPAGTTGCDIRCYLGSGVSGGGAGQVQWDGLRLSETTGLVVGTVNKDADYFDGNGSIPADAHYANAWTGTASNSTSTRTKLDSRSPDALSRKPGTTAWGWLSPIVQAAGLRLFCDEQRVWQLVDNSYAVTGTVTITQAVNLTDGADTIDIGTASSGDSGYVEQVVVHYSWLDSTATTREAWDSAGIDGGITLVVEQTTAYPGPGAAAAILARMQGRKRTLSLKGLTNLAATPGMDAAATLPTTIQVGKVSSVTFGDDDEMTVGTRGLIQTPANAWLFAAGPWSAATGSWSAATGTN